MKTRISFATAMVMTAIFVALGVSCGEKENPGTDDENASVPSGDPPFTSLTTSWVIDNAGAMSPAAIAEASAVCQKLQDDGVAELVVLIQNGVKHPVEYATHYGRWLRLGKKGLSTEGGNNGLVWLIRPDTNEKMTYSIGRGLPRLTSGHMLDVLKEAKEYINFNNYDKGIPLLVRETDKQLRELYTKKGTTP